MYSRVMLTSRVNDIATLRRIQMTLVQDVGWRLWQQFHRIEVHFRHVLDRAFRSNDDILTLAEYRSVSAA